MTIFGKIRLTNMTDALYNINETALKFLSPLPPKEAYATIIKEALKLVDGIHGSIVLEQEGKLQRVYSTSSLVQRIPPRKDGYIYQVYKLREPLAVDVENIPWLDPQIKHWGIKTLVLVPLLRLNRCIGVLTIQSLKDKKLLESNLDMLKIFGSLVSLVIINLNLKKEAEKAEKDRDISISSENTLEKINKSALKFLGPLTTEETYATIVKEAVSLVNAQYGSLFLEENGELKRVYSTLPGSIKLSIRKNSNTMRSFNEQRSLVLYSDEIRSIHQTKEKIDIKSNIFIPLSYKRQPVGVLIINSSAKERFTQKELKSLELFGSLASLAIKKVHLYQETQKALEIRDLFISLAAHELRTPITTISGYVQLLFSKLAHEDSSESRWIKELQAETQRLTFLVNELLQVNRIKKGELEFIWKECSLKEIIERAISNFNFKYPNYNVVFKDQVNSDSDIVIGDFDKLLQMLGNLLDNAAKFSTPDNDIIVSLVSKPSSFIIIVEDKGKGIPRKDLPKIFEGFYKGSGNSGEGMGLGLFLAKNIVRNHRGDIKIKSKVDKGTTVEIKLPRMQVGG